MKAEIGAPVTQGAGGARIGSRRRPGRGRSGKGGVGMIVRISGEDQYRLDDGCTTSSTNSPAPRTPRWTPTTKPPSLVRSPSCSTSCAPTARSSATRRSRPQT